MKKVSFTSVCDFQGGTQPPKEEWETNYKPGYIRMLQIRDFTQKKESHIEYVRISNRLKICNANDILIGRYGASIGKILTGLEGAYNVAIIKTIPDETALSKLYLYYILKDVSFQSFISNIGSRAAQAGFNKEDLSNFQISLPPLDDQIRIATILTRAERLIAKRKDSIKALDELLKSTFLEMFGDPKTNPKQFAVDKLKNLYIDPRNGTKCGPFGSALKKAEFVAEGIPVWNMDNISASGQMVMPFRMWITEDKYCELESYSVIDGDVIISRAGTVGKMCVAKMHNEKSIISTNLIRIRFGKRILPIYFVSLMNYCKGRVGRLKTGPDGSFTHMNTGVLDVLEFPIPLIELQNQFAAIVEKIESIKARYTQSLEELENLYGSLSQRAFKGELDLSKVPLEQEHHMIEVSDEGTAEEIIMTEVPASKTYSDAELMDIIRKIPGGKFTFSSLMDEIKKADFDEMPEYEKIKTYLYQMLDEANPRLSQVFDEEDKQIVLRVDP